MSMRSDKEQTLLAWQDQAAVLQGIAAGAPLHQVLDDLALVAESGAEGLSCEIWVIDPTRGIIVDSAGPNLPEIYQAFDWSEDRGIRGRSVRLSGTQRRSGYRRGYCESDRRWLGSRWRDNCLAHGLRSCQSKPIIDCEGRIVGTFAIYHQLPDALARSEPAGTMATLLSEHSNRA